MIKIQKVDYYVWFREDLEKSKVLKKMKFTSTLDQNVEVELITIYCSRCMEKLGSVFRRFPKKQLPSREEKSLLTYENISAENLSDFSSEYLRILQKYIRKLLKLSLYLGKYIYSLNIEYNSRGETFYLDDKIKVMENKLEGVTCGCYKSDNVNAFMYRLASIVIDEIPEIYRSSSS